MEANMNEAERNIPRRVLTAVRLWVRRNKDFFVYMAGCASAPIIFGGLTLPLKMSEVFSYICFVLASMTGVLLFKMMFGELPYVVEEFEEDRDHE